VVGQEMAAQDSDLPAEVPSLIEDIISTADGLPLPPAVKRSLWKSVGRLIGSVTDLGIAAVEHGTARIEAKTDAVNATAKARRVVKLGMAAKVPDMIAGDEALSMRAVAYLGHEMLVEQANRERIVEHAVEDLRSAPPKEDPKREIDDDWLHTFMKDASTKSAPEMQLLFGKVLSGEIKRPGTFSMKAVRVLSMLSPVTARQFEKLCNLSVSFLNRAQVISYAGQAGQNSLAKHGLSFDVLNNLNENDLIYSDYNAWFDWHALAEVRMPFSYANEIVWIEKKDKSKLNRLSKVHGITFSEIGKELRLIVSMQSDSSYTSELTKYFEKSGCDLMKMIGRREGGALIGRPYRDLL
jgi:Protein of unknown function (DUF2806)